MAKEDEGAEGAGGAPRPRSRRLLLLVILIFVLVLAGGGAYYFFFMRKAQDAAKTEEAPKPPKTYVFYNLPGFIVNLPGTAGRTSFLKITLSLELDSSADVAPVQAVMPRIIDYIQAYLRELKPEDLKGTAGLSRARQELLDRVRDAAPTANVNDVLFQEVLIQ